MSLQEQAGGGCLFVVATPLGNLQDISVRAAQCLAAAQVIFAEDTRRSRILLEHLAIATRLRSLHAHNEQQRVDEVVQVVQRGGQVALLSDAGTPAVSDPGAELVAAVHEAGLRVVPVAGPSALTAALSVAGFALNDAGMLFVGFVPHKGAARAAALQRVAQHAGVVVLFEAPHRVGATLAALAAQQPARSICVCRELTKIHEEVRRGTLAQLTPWAAAAPRGEYTLVLAPFVDAARAPLTPQESAVVAALERCLSSGMSSRDAVHAVALVLQLPRRVVYQLAGTKDKSTNTGPNQ